MSEHVTAVLSRRKVVVAGAFGAAIAATAVRAQASYPMKPVRVVVPFPAGTSPDVIARLWGQRFTKATGQAVVVENKAGAATIVGTQAVLASPADGYTLLWTVNNTFSINPYTYKKLPYKADDFVPVTRILSVPYVLFVSADSKLRSLDDLVREAKARPGQMNYASAGIGTGLHVALARLLNAAGVTMTHVPYKESFVPDVIAGRIDVAYDASTGAIPNQKAGKIRALAVSGAKRIDVLPEVPTVGETFAGYIGDSWHGIFAAKGTPDDVVAFIAAQSKAIVDDPEFRAKLRDYGLTPVNEGPAEFRRFLTEDARGWAKVVKDNGISAE